MATTAAALVCVWLVAGPLASDSGNGDRGGQGRTLLRPWQVGSRAVAADREPQLADLAGDYQVVLRMACGLELHECLQPVKENRPSGASEFKQKQTGHQE